MSTAKPIFSIVIPTRNRAHLLKNAIQSALNQGFDDYEIVVSNNNSTDATEEVAWSFESSRLRYVRVENTLAMPDHWEFAMDQARGRYVTYLCDDDALASDALETVARTLAVQQDRMIVMGSAVYFSSAWHGRDRSDTVSIYEHTGKVFERSTADTYRAISACQSTYRLPRALNCFVDRELVQTVRQRAGRVFLFSPDYSFPALTLTELAQWVYIDMPLRLQGVFPESIGASAINRRGQAAEDFQKEFKNNDLYKHVPLKATLITNAIAETYLQAKALLPRALYGFRIDWARYFQGCWRDILQTEAIGVDMTPEKAELFRALKRQPKKVRDSVLSVIQPSMTAPSQTVFPRAINPKPLLARAQNSFRYRLGLDQSSPLPSQSESAFEDDPQAFTVVAGTEGAFENILECLRALPRLRQATLSPVRKSA